MKNIEIASVLIALFGLYLIFQAIIIGLLPVTIPVFSLVWPTGDMSDSFGGAALVFPLFLILGVMGILTVRKSPQLGAWVLSKSIGVAAPDEVEGVDNNQLGLARLLVTLLGIFMLFQSVPGALSAFTSWVQTAAWEETTYNQLGLERRGFKELLPTVIYHVTAISFAVYVMLRGRGFKIVIESIRGFGR